MEILTSGRIITNCGILRQLSFLGKVFIWDGRILAKIDSLLLGWRIKWDFGRMDGIGINLSNWLSQGCMVLLLTGRPL